MKVHGHHQLILSKAIGVLAASALLVGPAINAALALPSVSGASPPVPTGSQDSTALPANLQSGSGASSPATVPSSPGSAPAASPQAPGNPSAAPSNSSGASGSTSGNSGADSGANAGTTSDALKGGVATSEQTTEGILVELEETVKHLKDAAWGAFTEAQRPDVVFLGGPNVIGGVVIPAVGQSGMISTGGFLPPRKKWIDYYAMHVNYLGPILKQELESFKLPADASSDTLEDFVMYHRIAERLPDLCSKMLIACQGPKYDNMTITMAAGMLNEELKRYDKERKKILKDIRDDFKDNSDAWEKKEKEARNRENKEKAEQKRREKDQN